MYSVKASSTLPISRQAAQLSRAVVKMTTGQPGLHLGCITTVRSFSSTPSQHLKSIFPAPENTRLIRKTEPAWPHPGFTEADMLAVGPAYRTPKTWSDRITWSIMKVARFGMDLTTNYKETPKAEPGVPIKYPMSPAKWYVRVIFLESIAGVPGMVAGMLRHLYSMRRLRRDNGWIETLLEESYNERMHLLTFLKMCEPGWFMRLMILGAQGVFFNVLFASYLISPSACHRFVGYIEEEAVYTYTRMIKDLEAGYIPEWTDPKFKIPDIAIEYWNMPEGKQTMRDLLLYIRADEAKHREVNHTLGNLNQKLDPNPFVSQYKDESIPHPSKGINKNYKPVGWERDEIL